MQELKPSCGETYGSAREIRRYVFMRVGISLAVLLSVTVFMQSLLLFAIVGIYPAAESVWWLSWVLAILPLYVFGLPAFWLSLKGLSRGEACRVRTVSGQDLPKPAFGVGSFLLLTVVGLGLLYIGNLMGTALMELMSVATGHDYHNALSGIFSSSPTWAVILGAVVIAPIGEELIFRKLLIDRTRGFGDVTAILLSAVSFGLFHGNFFQFFYAFLIGAVLAYMYTWSGNWLWSAGLHMLINLVGGVVVPYIVGGLNLDGDPAADASVAFDYMIALGIEALSLGLMLAAVGILIYLFCTRKVYLGQGESGGILSRADRVSATLGNAGMVLAALLYGGYMALSLLPL